MRSLIWKFAFVIILICMSSEAIAVIFHQIDTTCPLKCRLSMDHQNRIMVNDGRIQKVIFPEGKFSVQMEEESGQIFVYPVVMNQIQTLSIITENNFVQDLEIEFQSRSSEVVILSEPDASSCDDKQDEITRDIEEKIFNILSGESPKGFVAFEDMRKEIVVNHVAIKRLVRFEGDKETIYLFAIKNCNETPAIVYEQFFHSAPNWVYVVQNYLKSKEETVAIVSINRPNE